MSKINLNAAFSVIPEGTYIFKITKVEYKETFGKLEISMETKDGKKHTERFSLLTDGGNVNQGAMNAFSYFARTAMGDYDLASIDHTDLIGHYIECEVKHDVQPNKNKPGQTVTFLRLGDKHPAYGFDGEEAPAPASVANYDLDSLLG